jgi:signal transduction histidine kinase
LAVLLGSVWVGSLLFTAGAGHVLASRALRPVQRITERARSIARGAYSVRLDPPAVDDEIGKMTRLLNEMLESLEAAIEVNRRFAADASHELRTPVTAIRGEVDVILKRERTAEEYREGLEKVRSYAQRMSELIESLMFLVRAQEGRSSVDLQETPLTRLLREAAARRGSGCPCVSQPSPTSWPTPTRGCWDASRQPLRQRRELQPAGGA